MNNIEQTTPVNYMTDYGVFNKIFQGEQIIIKTDDITPDNHMDYYNGLLNLFRDYIENENLQNTRITFDFGDGVVIHLTTADALINISMWSFIINAGRRVRPRHIFLEKDGITRNAIEKYINKYCIDPNRSTMRIEYLNNLIYTSLSLLRFVDEFGMFFNNAICIEDFIDLCNASPEFDELIHGKERYRDCPVDQINPRAMEDVNTMKKFFVNAKKFIGRSIGLGDATRAKVGMKDKQMKELGIIVGAKPNGEGGIGAYTIEGSYLVGGLRTLEETFIDSGNGRIAQIITKRNTADSGSSAKRLGMNCMDTSLYCKPGTSEPDPTYDCHTKNYVPIIIPNKKWLKLFADRYYRYDPHGLEFNIGHGDMLVDNHPAIGKLIYLRSPITCSSAAKGLGICKKCYGELFNTNSGFNVGKTAAEIISAILTQVMLSAKHLLEVKIYNPKWVGDIDKYLNIEEGIVSMDPSLQVSKKCCVVISRDDICIETIEFGDDDDDDSSIDKEYINSFRIVDEDGVNIEFHTQENDNLFITPELSKLVHSRGLNNDDELISIPVHLLQAEEIPMFEMGIFNDDLSNKLKKTFNTLNLKKVTESFTKEEFLQEFLSNLIDCGLDNVMSVHSEIIIMNQIRSSDDILTTPDWDIPNQTNYQVLTLRRALETNPSITVSLQFDNIAKTLYNPLSFKKKKPSRYDLFHHVQPQKFIASTPEVEVKGVPAFVKVERDDE